MDPLTGEAVTDDVGEAHREAVQCVRAAGFDVHKEEYGEKIQALGIQIGGDPPVARVQKEKIELLEEATWYLAHMERVEAEAVEIAQPSPWKAISRSVSSSIRTSMLRWPPQRGLWPSACPVTSASLPKFRGCLL